METSVLINIPKIIVNMDILMYIGRKFEESGMCSIDTMKVLKKAAE